MGWFLTGRTNDPLLYAPAAIDGHAMGAPEAKESATSLLAYQNVDLAVQ